MGYAILFLAVLIADQLTKAIAFALYGNASALHEWIPNFLGIKTTVNDGISLGWLGDKEWLQPVVIALTALAIVVFFIVFLKLGKNRRFLRTALILIIVGAAGNLIDRAVMQGVRDLVYMNFGFVDFSNNIADDAVTVGAVMFIIALLFVDKEAIFRSRKGEEKRAVLDAVSELDENARTTDNDLGEPEREERASHSSEKTE